MCYFFIFFFNYPASTELYTLSLHDALPISTVVAAEVSVQGVFTFGPESLAFGFLAHPGGKTERQDRKSTRLNSSHVSISYAVFCLKKKIITIPFSSRQSN